MSPYLRLAWCSFATYLGPAIALAAAVDCNSVATVGVLNAAKPLEARAYWLNGRLATWPGVEVTGHFRLHYSMQARIDALPGKPVSGAGGALPLNIESHPWPEDLTRRFRFVGKGVTLAVQARDVERLREWHRGQLVLTREDERGRVLEATALQSPGALDDLFAAAASASELGVSVPAAAGEGPTRFRLWAPTAQRISVCTYPSGDAPASAMLPMKRDGASGVWTATTSANLTGAYYQYLVDVFVRGTGLVRTRVTDPYSASLTTDSRRSYVANLDAETLRPALWKSSRSPDTVNAPTDLVIYELHLRDFSSGDATVPPADRGKYLAFTHADSDGMKHLKALAAAGLTDVHLMPVFDFATVPEQGCLEPQRGGPPDGEAQQAAVGEARKLDCYNWGYDPWHYTAPEGSYASDPADGARRIVEMRAMVGALHRAGLRVGMDVVYNHTYAAGLDERSVLDRIVPGYYHRLDARGNVEHSTCCENTATEHLMMERLMSDSVVTWARDYGIDSFRFDLMGHQPREAMVRLARRLKEITGRDIALIGEGWNFGEVAGGTRFVQASQDSLGGTGIGTFSDRARDAVRGGGAGDEGAALATRRGWINGFGHEDADAAALSRAAEIVRLGLAGTLRGSPGGYAQEPSEVVNYVENHDNPTLFDIDALRLPRGTSREGRAQAQAVALATTAFSQGIAYFHAGVDLLRSKSLDRNSYDSGDWFNRIDWSGTDNGFGAGLPPAWDNERSWPVMRPVLADASIKPTPAEIAWTREAFRDLLRIRASSTLFRLRTARDIRERLSFPGSPGLPPAIIVGHLDGRGYPGARFEEIVYILNADAVAHVVDIASLAGRHLRLHPVHTAPGAADARIANDARFDRASGRIRVPARSATVFVKEDPA
jgi:pullulanase